MEWIVIFVLGALVWFWLKGKTKTRSPQTVQRTAEVPEVRVTFTTTVSRGNRGDEAPRDVGDLVKEGEDTWVLNPKSPLPLTVVGADRRLAEQLKSLLGTREYWSQKVPEVALLIAQHNLRFREVDLFVSQHKRQLDADVSRQVAASTEWPAASEKDRADLRSEFQEKAIESLGISIGRADLGELLTGQPSAFDEDDELVRRFAGVADLYSFYLAQPGLTKPKLVLSRLTELTSQACSPHPIGVDHRVINSRTGHAYVATYVPESDGGPYMARLGEDRYFVRSGGSFLRMEHFQVADMFGRRARPVLKVDLVPCEGRYEVVRL